MHLVGVSHYIFRIIIHYKIGLLDHLIREELLSILAPVFMSSATLLISSLDNRYDCMQQTQLELRRIACSGHYCP